MKGHVALAMPPFQKKFKGEKCGIQLLVNQL